MFGFYSKFTARKNDFNLFSSATSVCLQIFVNIIIFLFNPPVSRLHSDLWYCSKLLHARPPPPPAWLLTIIQDRSSHCSTLWSENFTNVMIIICLYLAGPGAPLVLISGAALKPFLFLFCKSLWPGSRLPVVMCFQVVLYQFCKILGLECAHT